MLRAGFKLKPEEMVDLLKHEMEAKHMELAGRYDSPIPPDRIREWHAFLRSVIKRYPPEYENHIKILKQLINQGDTNA